MTDLGMFVAFYICIRVTKTRNFGAKGGIYCLERKLLEVHSIDKAFAI